MADETFKTDDELNTENMVRIMREKGIQPPGAGAFKITHIHRAPESNGPLLYDGLDAKRVDAVSHELTRKCFEYTDACRKHYGALANEDVSRLFGEVVDAAQRLGFTHSMLFHGVPREQ